MNKHRLPFSIIACQGVDAQDFLHNQLTQSVNDLTADQARLFAYCTPQGRVMVDGLYWRHAEKPDTFYLMLHESMAETLLRRLQMYVLRSKVTMELLADAEVVGSNHPVLSGQSSDPVAANEWQLPMHWEGNVLSIQAAGTQEQAERFWLIDLDGPTNQETPLQAESLIKPEAWLCQEVMTGWAWITEQNTELFIPQNINLDILPAVNFAKGCFPGQEVVARSHYRATIRKRAVLMQAPIGKADTPIDESAAKALIGTDVILAPEAGSEAQNARAVGRIASCALNAEQLWTLVETQLDHILNHAQLAPANHPELILTHAALPFEDQLPWEKKK